MYPTPPRADAKTPRGSVPAEPDVQDVDPMGDPQDTPAGEDLAHAPTREVFDAVTAGLGKLATALAKTGGQVGAGAKVAGQKAVQTAAELRLKDHVATTRHSLAAAGGLTATGAKKAAAAAVDARIVLRDKGSAFTQRTGDGLTALVAHLDQGRLELANRANAAQAAGVDLYDRHREEVLALLVTAAKVATVIGVRRLTAPRPGPDGTIPPAKRRIKEASRVVFAISAELGRLIAKNPSGLPLLRERFMQGDEAEQAVVGLILGPALSEDPEYALAVIEEFLGDAQSDAAADTIARRALAPLLRDHPGLAGQVGRWVAASRPLVRRAALVALERHLHDPRSRVGDALTAAVLVLEDHDQEVRQALGWFLRAAAGRDLDRTADAIVRHLDAAGPDTSDVMRGHLETVPGLARAVAVRRRGDTDT